MKQIILSIFMLLSLNVFAQKVKGKMHKMNWDTYPSLHHVNEDYKDESVVFIQDYRYINYKKKSQDYVQYKTVHKVIRVNDEIGVKATNQISIPLRRTDVLYRLQVRTLSPSGKVTTLKSSSIKWIKSDEGHNYGKFAVEGLEVGGEVEYIYTIQSGMQSYGREYFQSQAPIQSAKFKLYLPVDINFLSKSYNGLSGVKIKAYKARENSYLRRQLLVVEDSNIAPFTKEGLSNFRSKLKRVDYKIKGSVQVENYLTWETISKRTLANLQQGNGDMKVMKFFKDLDLENMPLEERIAAIESKIKSEINIEPRGGDEYSNIWFVVKNKLANYNGLIKLYMKSFISYGINLDVVMASNRFNGEIDSNFPHGMDLDFPIFYFKEIDKYITPHNLEARLGYPSPEFAGSNALFIELRSLKDYRNFSFDYAECSIKPLPTMDMEMTKNSTTATVQIKNEEAYIDYVYSTTGYRAANDRMYMKNYLTQDDNLEKGIIRGLEDIVVESHEFINDDIKHSLDSQTPFKLKAQLRSQSLIESLGDDMLVKVGMLIGTQSKLYNEENRANDVILRYKKFYEHHIKVLIPDGYICSNLDEFKKDISILDGDNESLFFHLNYTLTDNILDISVKEGYNTLEVKTENYQDYRKVVNSAADFNALNVVLEKQL